MEKENCVIYSGKFYQVEWYFDIKGNSQAFEYFSKCDLNQKRKFLLLCQKIADFGYIMDKSKFRSEDDSIYAFKPQPDRYLCFFKKGKKIIVTNAYRKSGNKMPKNEKKMAKKNMNDYLSRYPNEEE